jgi:hypothetical protein
VIANGHYIDSDASPLSLEAAQRARFALQMSPRFLSRRDWSPQTLVKSAFAVVRGKTMPLSSANAVWTEGPLLSRDECSLWIQRAEALDAVGAGLETGDFIFKQGSGGLEKMATGARRYSATRVIVDQDFAMMMEERMAKTLPEVLNDGRKLIGIGESFLLSRYTCVCFGFIFLLCDSVKTIMVSSYHTGQYFAPHYDGTTILPEGGRLLAGSASEFTVVLYLTGELIVHISTSKLFETK